LISLGLALSPPSTSVSSDFMVLCKCFLKIILTLLYLVEGLAWWDWSCSIFCDSATIITYVYNNNNNNKKDGYRQRNVRQFLHILASPGYATGTITVNVTWMKRGFNVCQTHVPIYLQPFPSNSTRKFKSSPF